MSERRDDLGKAAGATPQIGDKGRRRRQRLGQQVSPRPPHPRSAQAVVGLGVVVGRVAIPKLPDPIGLTRDVHTPMVTP